MNPPYIWLRRSKNIVKTKFLEENYILENIMTIEGAMSWGFSRWRRKDLPEEIL